MKWRPRVDRTDLCGIKLWLRGDVQRPIHQSLSFLKLLLWFQKCKVQRPGSQALNLNGMKYQLNKGMELFGATRSSTGIRKDPWTVNLRFDTTQRCNTQLFKMYSFVWLNVWRNFSLSCDSWPTGKEARPRKPGQWPCVWSFYDGQHIWWKPEWVKNLFSSRPLWLVLYHSVRTNNAQLVSVSFSREALLFRIFLCFQMLLLWSV